MQTQPLSHCSESNNDASSLFQRRLVQKEHISVALVPLCLWFVPHQPPPGWGERRVVGIATEWISRACFILPFVSPSWRICPSTCKTEDFFDPKSSWGKSHILGRFVVLGSAVPQYTFIFSFADETPFFDIDDWCMKLHNLSLTKVNLSPFAALCVVELIEPRSKHKLQTFL